jgi:heme exporter protein D
LPSTSAGAGKDSQTEQRRMFDLGPHAGFIWLSYGAAALCVAGLSIWAWAGEREQRRRLDDLERRGLRRRSSQQEL